MFGCSTDRMLSLACILFIHWNVAHAMLLSDVPTPSFVVDMGALKRRTASIKDPSTIPALYIPKHGLKLLPMALTKGQDRSVKREALALEMAFDSINDEAVGFLHSSVTRAKEDAVAGQDEPLSTFLAEIDLTPTLCGEQQVIGDNNNNKKPPLATLVLGLNNHHVGSYYWARSAGAGASMDAPGVLYDGSDASRGILRWETEGGPTECNTNDGKRSEWVNFLRKGDTIQLIPNDGQDAIASFVDATFEEGSTRVFGVSNEGRPLGSEPEVVCQWTCQ